MFYPDGAQGMVFLMISLGCMVFMQNVLGE